jgi:hypothetical protein
MCGRMAFVAYGQDPFFLQDDQLANGMLEGFYFELMIHIQLPLSLQEAVNAAYELLIIDLQDLLVLKAALQNIVQ